MTGQAITDAELGAYVDGELAGRDEARVEAALADDAALRDRLAQAIASREAVAAVADGDPLDAPDPETEALAARLGARLKAETARRSRRRASLAVAVLAAAALGGWFAHIYVGSPGTTASLEAGEAPAFVADAVGAHAVFAPDQVHPVEFFSDDEATMRDWFAGHLGEDVRIPHLEEIGFDLVGGRLLGSARGPSAQLIYENAGGDRVSLVFGRQDLPGATDAPRMEDVDGRLASWWRQGEFSYAVVEDRPGADVMTVAKRIVDMGRRP